ncbi:MULTISPECIES: nucleotidyltransferase family protein [unclassified Endozoicomonas]|uniref:nucleotidyltransferase family protein n=1 Tax=unclassified Endozoicomonas TaxID=2644528 RepID=UPI00214926C4|nr:MULTISPECIES: nucleotidyltransferase domain-containing protein [unclassified Endozoicomonas]
MPKLTMNELREYRVSIIRIVESYHCSNPGVFGSLARNGYIDEGNDIDILVESTDQTTLFDIGNIECDLKDLLNIPVDVVARESIYEPYRKQIEQDIRVL